MKKSLPILFVILLSTFISVSQQFDNLLAFTSTKNGINIPTDSILIQNISQGCDTMLYYPDTVLSYVVSNISVFSKGDKGFALSQNFPNPFTKETEIQLHLSQYEFVKIIITDVLGRKLSEFEKTLDKGIHSFRFKPGSAKYYILSVFTENHSKAIKMLCENQNNNNPCELKYLNNNTFYSEYKINEELNCFYYCNGDELKFTGFTTIGAKTISDSPTGSQIYTFGFSDYTACQGIPFINYEGKYYNTLQIGDQCWLKENLDVGYMISGVFDMTDDNQIEKYCYNDDPFNCELYGGLYQWDECMNYTNVEKAQGICPEGWHLPTDAEWFTLEHYLDSTINDPSQKGWRGVNGGSKLKVGGSSDFDALMAGWRYITIGEFLFLGDRTIFWSSSENDDRAWFRILYHDNPGVNRNETVKYHGNSIRCIHDSMIVNSLPDIPSLPQPANGSTNIETDTTLSWYCSDPDGDELSYNIYFGTSLTFKLVQTNFQNNTYTPQQILNDSTYLWKIVAYDVIGDSTEGPVWHFTTGTFTCGEDFVDDRDGQIYGTIAIGEQCWMKENLNIGTMIPGSINMSNNEIFEKYCFDDIPENCDTWGGLYQWDETMQYITVEGSQGVCPEGWHVPSDSEWFTLENYVDPTITNPVQKNWRGVDCGTKLKINGSSGFDALMAGWRYHDGEFLYSDERTIFWSSTKHGNFYWFRILYVSNPKSYRNETLKTHGNSIRCLKNEFNLNDPPQVPSQPEPYDNALEVDIDTHLSWICSDPNGDEITYNIYFGTYNTLEMVTQNHPTNNFDPGILHYDSSYFWKIVAYDIAGDSTEGPLWSFTTKSFGCNDLLLDDRDGQVYSTVQINNQCWMAQNLNIGTRIDAVNDMTNNNVLEKYCYDDIDDNCSNFGGLYQWNELMDYTNDPGATGICPTGWHVPTDYEWFMMENYLDPTISNPTTKNWRGIDGGTQLKEGGTSGFEALFGGAWWNTYNNYQFIDTKAFFWTSSIENPGYIFYRTVDNNHSGVYKNATYPVLGYSVRCVKSASMK